MVFDFFHNRMILQIQVQFMIHYNPWKGGEWISSQPFVFLPTYAVNYICLNVVPCTHLCWTTSGFFSRPFHQFVKIILNSHPILQYAYSPSQLCVVWKFNHMLLILSSQFFMKKLNEAPLCTSFRSGSDPQITILWAQFPNHCLRPLCKSQQKFISLPELLKKKKKS